MIDKHATPSYELARLVPRNLYATQVRDLLRATRRALAAISSDDFTIGRIDKLMRDVATSQEVAPSDLFAILRVVFQWPVPSIGLLESIANEGRDDSLRAIDRSLLLLSDVAGLE